VRPCDQRRAETRPRSGARRCRRRRRPGRDAVRRRGDRRRRETVLELAPNCHRLSETSSLSGSALAFGWLRAGTLPGAALRLLKDSAIRASPASRRDGWHFLNTSLSRRRGLWALAELPMNFGQSEIGIRNRRLRQRNRLAALGALDRSVSAVQGGGAIAGESKGACDPEFRG